MRVCIIRTSRGLIIPNPRIYTHARRVYSVTAAFHERAERERELFAWAEEEPRVVTRETFAFPRTRIFLLVCGCERASAAMMYWPGIDLRRKLYRGAVSCV